MFIEDLLTTSLMYIRGVRKSRLWFFLSTTPYGGNWHLTAMETLNESYTLITAWTFCFQVPLVYTLQSQRIRAS